MRNCFLHLNNYNYLQMADVNDMIKTKHENVENKDLFVLATKLVKSSSSIAYLLVSKAHTNIFHFFLTLFIY